MEEKKYAVITYGFDMGSSVCLFADEQEAEEYLLKLWEDTYNTELVESYCGLCEEECFHEESFAMLSWRDGHELRFEVIQVSEPFCFHSQNKK